MPKTPEFDLTAAHTYFSAHCFNATWDLLDKAERTLEEDRRMVALSQASIYHWLNRPDCANQPLSIGYWLASRVQATLGNASEAQSWAQICLDYSGELEPFYIGYAFEALARAAHLNHDDASAAALLTQAEAQAALVADKEDRDVLLKDLGELRRAQL
jgi:hypothetical protein